jgi:hypothetical protein
MSIWNKEIDRRTLLKGSAFVGGAVALGAADGFLIEPRWLDVTRRAVPIDGLPRAVDGFRLAQLTDLHLTGLSGIHDEIVASVDAFSPQLVAITGDMFDERTTPADVETLCDQLVRPGRRVVATLGNWEHWSGVPVEKIDRLYARHDIELLVNEHLALADGLVVAGTDDGCTHRANLSKTFEHLPDADLRLLLTHAPGLLDHYPSGAPSFDLTLCGHTHGGQINLAGFAPIRPPGSGRFVAGEYATGAGLTYVSRGIGTSVLPVRFMCRPELVLVEFVAA